MDELEAITENNDMFHGILDFLQGMVGLLS